MPFKSKAQRRKFAELLVKGEITPETFEEWNRETGGKELPERVAAEPAKRKTRAKKAKKPKKPKKAKTTKTAKTARKAKPARKSAKTRSATRSRAKKPTRAPRSNERS